MIGGAVLAAGSSRRFGAPKQLAELHGRPLLEHTLRAMDAAPVGRVVCVLGAAASAIQARVDLRRATPVVCADWQEGQAAALRSAVRELAGCDAVVLTLGDQPLISPLAISRVLSARDPGLLAVRATYDGVPGHPTVIERGLFAEVLRLRGDAGARGLLGRVPLADVPCDGLGSAVDVDTPADLAELERASGSPPPRAPTRS